MVILSTRKIPYVVETEYTLEDPQFRRSMEHLMGQQFMDGNQVTELVNGVQIFPSMLDAIRGAKETINFETYIYWSGEIGKVFAEALSERARAGVEVNVLLDWLGTKKLDEQLVEEMRKSGAKVEKYHPLRWFSPSRVNHRTHRKLLIVDGRIGFTGGVGIADEWTGDADSREHWRDNHYRVEGPVVASLQGAFMDNWMKTQSKVLHDHRYFPKMNGAGNMPAQIVKSSPREGNESVRLMYMLALAAARERIMMSSAYFVPDHNTMKELTDARRRGVQVQIIMPGEDIDYPIVRNASISRWGLLLEAGIEIYEYQPTMYHCKVVVIDDRWVSVGSTNFDNRSFRLNDEANLNVLDVRFGRRQREIFEVDLEKSQRVTLEQWRNRPLREKLTQRAAAMLASQL